MNTVRVACAWGMALAAVGVAHGQVAEATFPTSYLRVGTGNMGNSINIWVPFTPYPNSFNFGQGNNTNGVAGGVQHAYSGGQLASITVELTEMRTQYSGVQPFNDPSGHCFGQILLTPAVNTPYTIGGSVSMVLSGSAASSQSASGSVWLEQVSGPMVASFGSSMFRNTNTAIVGSIYDSSAPLFGSATGMLSAGVTYRFGWDFATSGLVNMDSGMYGNIFGLDGPQFFSISFVPGPGAAGLLGLGGVLAGRRRRA